MIIDVHCHYTLSRLPHAATDRFSFEPADNAGSNPNGQHSYPTDFDSCVSPRAVNRAAWRAARWYLKYPPPGPALDQQLRAEYAEHLTNDGPIERFVLLAFDAVHDDDGRCVPLPERGARPGSDIYTANSLVRKLCRDHPDRFLFGASIHPYRPNAPDCVEELFHAGACLLKWIPLHQNIDVTDERTLAVLRRCATLRLPLLVHVGEEFTLRTNRPEFRSIRPLLEALRRLRRDGAMPPTIIAHAATPATPFGDRSSHRILLEALHGEFADAPLYADISAFTTWTKIPYMRRLARRQPLHRRLLFGSDFPVPAATPRLRRDLGSDFRRISAIRSWPQRAVYVYRRLGFNEIVFHQAADLLPNVEFFKRDASGAPA
jgi:hypothetical protein